MNNDDDNPDDILMQPYEWVLVREHNGRVSAHISEFPGCAADGDDMSDALDALHSAAWHWLAAVVRQGLPVPKPKRDVQA